MADPEDKRLLEASASGQTDRVLQLLDEHGQQLHKNKDQDGKTALHLAAVHGHTETVSALSMNGADISAQDFTGHTPLQRAAAEGHCEVVKQLIGRGCPIDHQDDVHGNTALHEAAWKGYSRTVDLLCKNKSNYYLRNRGGFSPLHLCCQNGHNESCRVLLRAGCKPNIKNNYGDTPLHTAARYGHAGVARILLSASSNPNLQNKNGDSPLHIASAMGRRKLVRILLESPLIDLQLKNQQNETALEIGTRKNHQEIVAMIRHPPTVKKTEAMVSVKAEINMTHESEESKHHHKKSKSNKGRKKFSTGKAGIVEPKWSPYGCHYYPDMTEFPEPNVETLPNEPLQSGEQYYLDLAGNIKKGPSGHGSTCYCAPFIHRFEQKLDRNKKELVKHLETTHGQLATRINHLERKTRDQISGMSNTFKENLAQERLECQDRMERRAIRDRIATDRAQVVKHTMLRHDLTTWLDTRMKSLEDTASRSQFEQVALLRTLLRGSKRRKRALRSELNSGAIRNAMSEDEMDDNEHDPDNDILEEMLEQHESHAVAQSEYNFPISSSSIHVHNTDQLQSRLQGLHVSDHPRQLPASPKPTVRVRRNSAGDETMLYCDFGDFNTQELISSPIEFEQNKDFLAYSTHSESASNQSLLPRPIPFSPTSSSTSALYQNMTFSTNAGVGPPQLPPKSNIPPPYRPPPNTAPFFGGPRAFDDDPFHKAHSNLAMSSSDGGSHDSHNDSGYCAVRGSGGPSPSLSGSQGRPDSRGPPVIEVHDHHHPSQAPALKASLGPVIPNGSSVAPRIRQLQMQLSSPTNNNNPTCAPRGSLV